MGNYLRTGAELLRRASEVVAGLRVGGLCPECS